MRLTGGKGVNVLYDNIANPKVLPQAFRALGFDGRLVTAGAHGGPNVTIDFSHLYHKQITIKGTARLSSARRAEMLCGRGRGQDQAADRADPAAVARRRGAPAGRNRARRTGKIVLDPTHWARGSALKPPESARQIAPLRRAGGSAYIPAISVIPDDIQASPDGRSERRGDLAMSEAPLMPKATAVWLVENTSLVLRPGRRFLQAAPARGEGDRRRRRRAGHQGARPGADRPAHPRGDREGARPIRTTSSSCSTRRSACPRPSARRARATPRCRAARIGRTPSSGWCATIPSSRTARSCGSSAPPSRRSQAIRERTHWNASNLQPMDPVTLGLCSQIDLDLEVHRAAKEKPVDIEAQGATLLPASETTIRPREPEPEEKQARATSSTSTRCSPSSSRSAARASSAAPAAIQPYGITPARTSSRRTRARAAAGGSARYTSAQSRTPAQGRGSGRARPPRG